MQDKKSIYGIIGNPVAHSLSPIMYNVAFKELGVDSVYQVFPLEEDELKGFFDDLRKASSPIFGLNVTVPYKESVLPFMDSLNPLAEKIQAVNTIVVSPQRQLAGYNTDAPGFMLHLSELGFSTEDKKIAIMGAGGSARAIIAALCIVLERPASIKIYNRTKERLDALIEDLRSRINIDIVSSVMSIDDLEISASDLLINTTSVGLMEEDPCLVDEDLLHGDLLVYDLIYNPKETNLLKIAKEKGAKITNGLGMLCYQGVLALQHWAEHEMDETVKLKMREALEKETANE